MPSRILLVLALSAVAFSGCSKKKSVAEPAFRAFEVYALRYGSLPSFSKHSALSNVPKGEKIRLDLVFWLVKGKSRNILVDCGFTDPRLVEERNVEDYENPQDVLGKLGVKPSDINDLIITHSHWDHTGGLGLFDRATIWVQEEERDRLGGSKEFESADSLGRVRWLHGDSAVCPGIRLYAGGKHTPGIQFVTVDADSETIVLASDNAYLFKNIEDEIPIGATADEDADRKTILKMKSLAGRPGLVIPGHDPLIFSRFPVPGNGVARIR
jgi:glyoxylase-like metal-dependent hydrolase (beta-lactamase superfamily II)